MKPKRPLPTTQPFVTFLTNTYRRPDGLLANMRSVGTQTAVAEIEQIIVPDHLGHSPADAVYGRMPWYATAPRGEYVHVLGDDDVLAAEDVVARLKAFVRLHHEPPAVFVRVRKGDTEYPKGGLDADLKEGDVDLCCFVMRQDVWRRLIEVYCPHYKCDWDGLLALRKVSNVQVMPCDLLFAVGKVGGGRPELDW
jgi:hypothetical protein